VLEYDLFLDIDFDANSYRGILEISGAEDEGPIELDSVDLDVQGVTIAGESVPFELDESRRKLAIRYPGVAIGPVHVEFSGRAAEGVQTGFFVSQLGKSKALATMMEPESCRRFIPCFDRPDRKAVFRLRVTTRSDLVVISNMPPESSPTANGQRVWAFVPTPPMSTYLLFLGVGPFEETVDTDGPVEVRVAGPSGFQAQAARTAKIARTVLRGYSEYFDVPYPLPKLHFVTLTNFWVGMENWGAISGGEDHYLLDENATPAALNYAEQTIVHEAAHQWFGDLVTLKSWDDLWLNEAFATFVVPIVQGETHLRQDPWAEFVMWTQRGLRFDSLWCTHPVKPNSYNAAEIMANADSVTYFKGARLIRMIEAFLGHDPFRDGITEYLRDHEFASARSDDLWAALEEESGQAVASVMRTWVERPGHPCVTVHQEGPDVVLTQRRFTFVPRELEEEPWPIPLTWWQGADRHSMVFNSRRTVLSGVRAQDITLDPGRAGFFRILWAPELRNGALGGLGRLPPLDRSAFVHDAYSFLLSGDYTLDDFLKVLEAVATSTDRVTVEEVASSLELLRPVLADVPRFQEVAARIVRGQFERLGESTTPGEPEATDVVREWIVGLRVHFDPGYAQSLAARFDRVEQELPALRQAITSALAFQGGKGTVERLFARARGPDPDAAFQVGAALGEIGDGQTLIRALDESLTSLPMSSIFAALIPSASRNNRAGNSVWEWLARNLRGLEHRAQGTTLLALCFERSLPTLGIGRSDALRRYFHEEKFPEGLPGIQRGLELLEANEQLRRRVVPESPS
jgi:tricorn protease interacting factor F2/3